MLRSTGAETVATRFYRVEETHALPANVPLTIYGDAPRSILTNRKAQVFDHALRMQVLTKIGPIG
jgi:hypothetical protein